MALANGLDIFHIKYFNSHLFLCTQFKYYLNDNGIMCVACSLLTQLILLAIK